MLHLAQVQKNEFSGGVELRLLVRQQSEDLWSVMVPEEILPVVNTTDDLAARLYLIAGSLALVELSETNEILNIRDAKDWILRLVQQYLSSGISPALLQQETERAEQWRQDLTLQSQELARKTLEKEAHREQLQQLEEELKREKKQLEMMTAQLKLKEED